VPNPGSVGGEQRGISAKHEAQQKEKNYHQEIEAGGGQVNEERKVRTKKRHDHCPQIKMRWGRKKSERGTRRDRKESGGA